MSKLDHKGQVIKKKSKKYMIETIGIVSEMIRETDDTQTLRIEFPNLNNEDKPFRFKPGQFIMVRPKIDGKVIPRAYSISSSPTRSEIENGYIDLTVRQTEKPTVSKWLNDKKVGDEILFRGPYGHFFWDDQDLEAEEIIMLGAGSGITPLKSILEYIHDKGLDNKVTLIYSCRYEDEIIGKKELEKIIENTNNGKLIFTLTREKELSKWKGQRGRINVDFILRVLKERNYDLKKTKFYICGTPSFVGAMSDILVEIGIDKTKIMHEKWD